MARRGFDSPHLHRVFEAFPLVREGVTCEFRWSMTPFLTQGTGT
jgi:hypothetical protein